MSQPTDYAELRRVMDENEIERLEAENERLRELVWDMYECIRNANGQDWFYFERDKPGCGLSCTVNGEGCGLSMLAERARELGIEVRK